MDVPVLSMDYSEQEQQVDVIKVRFPGYLTDQHFDDLYDISKAPIFVPQQSHPHEPFGCPMLQDIQTHLDWRTGSTTSTDFLEVILTHRESFVAFPVAHRTCAKAFTQLALTLETRARDTQSDSDLDMSIALHNEAWLVSGWS